MTDWLVTGGTRARDPQAPVLSRVVDDKVSQLEMELEEERNNSDLLSERISRSREQISPVTPNLSQSPSEPRLTDKMETKAESLWIIQQVA
ncbi:hypothetical protein P7K49_016948 [Saguinus oedipus]|uniref:Uncharacterized protein n=1 Tax=Saguinus oedipus TaxID=9490 RepID=A0ABQ9V1I3_SAGOE|nr:hypothetical protein P7K49_016948 [Saguinus oedipus]